MHAGQLTSVKDREDALNTTVEARDTGFLQILASTLSREVEKGQEFLDRQSTYINRESDGEWNIADGASSVQESSDESAAIQTAHPDANIFPVFLVDPEGYGMEVDDYCGLSLFEK